MPTDRPPPPRSNRRTAAAPPKIRTGPKIGPMLPYVGLAAVFGALVMLVRQPRYATLGALLLGIAVMLGLGYVALSYRETLRPEDSLRRIVPFLTLLALVVAGVPYYLTLYPPAPQGEAVLTEQGQARTLELRGAASSVWLTVNGAFVPNALGTAQYSLTVTHDAAALRVDGVLRPHAGGPMPERHVLETRGPGRYTVRLEQTSAAVALPLRVAISARPFSTGLLAMIFGALAAVLIAVDVMLRSRGLEPSFAAALMLPLATVLYFQHRPMVEALPSELLAAGIVGALAGGLGGELLSRIISSLTSRGGGADAK